MYCILILSPRDNPFMFRNMLVSATSKYFTSWVPIHHPGLQWSTFILSNLPFGLNPHQCPHCSELALFSTGRPYRVYWAIAELYQIFRLLSSRACQRISYGFLDQCGSLLVKYCHPQPACIEEPVVTLQSTGHPITLGALVYLYSDTEATGRVPTA